MEIIVPFAAFFFYVSGTVAFCMYVIRSVIK